MVRFFEKQDKEEITALAEVFLEEKFNRDVFTNHFDEIVAGEGYRVGISVLHAGEYLGFSVRVKTEDAITVKMLYIKPEFQRLKVAPQVLDFIKEQFPGYSYMADVPQSKDYATKVFEKNGFDVKVI